MRAGWKISDHIRDEGVTAPDGVAEIVNLIYGPYGYWNMLDLYYPADQVETYETNGVLHPSADALAGQKLPVIISIHGGGWEYGDKELYRNYTMSLAARGFAVADFNYRLAPEDPFPSAFNDVNRLMNWIAANAAQYGLDADNIFLVGDSAGGQLSSWYATLMTSEGFRKLYEERLPLPGVRRETVPFTMEQYRDHQIAEEKIKDIPEGSMLPDESYPFHVPAGKLTIRAVAHNCGDFDVAGELRDGHDTPFNYCFIGAFYAGHEALVQELVDAWTHMDASYPPAFIMSAVHDPLLPNAQPMADHLKEKGVEAELHVYGRPEDLYMGHVFHCNLHLAEAQQCNEEECEFFRRHISRQDL